MFQKDAAVGAFKRIREEPATPTTSIRIPADLKAAAQREARKQRRTLSNLIIYLLAEYLKKQGN